MRNIYQRPLSRKVQRNPKPERASRLACSTLASDVRLVLLKAIYSIDQSNNIGYKTAILNSEASILAAFSRLASIALPVLGNFRRTSTSEDPLSSSSC